MKTANIPALNALCQIRQYAVKEAQDLREMIDSLGSSASDKRDRLEYEGSETAYCDIVRIIESQIVAVVSNE